MNKWVVIAIAVLLVVGTTTALADPLQELDNALRTPKTIVRDAAALNAMVVSIQTDVMGRDDVKPPINIRKVSEPLGRISRKRDSLAGACRHAAVVLKRAYCRR